MTTFLTILFILLAINVVLLVFSVNGARESLKKPFQRISESTVIKLFQKQYPPQTEYKEAV